MKNITEKIEALEAQLKELKQELNKPAFEVGKNYYFETDCGGLKWIANFKSINAREFNYNWDVVVYDNLNNNESFKENDWCHLDFYKREATDKEVEEALIKYFESQHGKPSNKWKVKGFWGKDIKSIGNSGYYYTKSGENIYFGYGSTCLMLNGKWAEIIKDEPIKIGGYPVLRAGDVFSIGCKKLWITDLLSLKAIMFQNDFKKAAFDGIETDLETIEKILKL